jgi:hypothetical protein
LGELGGAEKKDDDAEQDEELWGSGHGAGSYPSESSDETPVSFPRAGGTCAQVIRPPVSHRTA